MATGVSQYQSRCRKRPCFLTWPFLPIGQDTCSVSLEVASFFLRFSMPCTDDHVGYTATMPKRFPTLKTAHVELLQRVADGNSYAPFGSKPALMLVEQGLCVWIEREYSRRLAITDAGRAILQSDRKAA